MKQEFGKALDYRIIPAAALDNEQDAPLLAEALVAGGLPSVEITFRTKAAARAIEVLAGRGDMLVGAGTVLKVDQVRQAVDAGACYIVAPGFNPKVVSFCMDKGIPVVPGVSTPTDIEMALDYELEVVKFFPAEAFGGLKTLKAVCGPYKTIKFLPTGGIGPHNLLEYLKHPQVPACGGSWLVKSSLIVNGQFQEVARLAREAMDIVAQAGPFPG